MSVLNTVVCTQIGILCRDIEKTAKAWSEFLGQVYQLMESAIPEVAKGVYKGESTPARCRQAFFTLGDQVQLELIQPDEYPSVWRDDLEKRGEGVHHIAFQVKDTEGHVKKLAEMGMDCIMHGGWGTGIYSYIDARDQLKVMFELLENL